MKRPRMSSEEKTFPMNGAAQQCHTQTNDVAWTVASCCTQNRSQVDQILTVGPKTIRHFINNIGKSIIALDLAVIF